ncbi:transcription factor IIA subunit alpha [Agyrium rufum]|nr:transcription factor IIA subunit alpha [Agyrium rufum]
MSNAQVGQIYNRIIEDVIKNLRVTFEEEGVEQNVLEDMEKVWQSRLSANAVASFPWDPPAPVNPTPIPVPSNATNTAAIASTKVAMAPTVSSDNNASSGVTIKSEPQDNYGISSLSAPNSAPQYHVNQAALERAGQQLAEKFGSSASAQVNQLQARAALAGQQQQQQQQQRQAQHPPAVQATNGPNGQPIAAESQHIKLEQQRRAMFQQQQQQQQHQRHYATQQVQGARQPQPQYQRGAVDQSQTDGASDWAGLVNQRRAEVMTTGSNESLVADQTIRELVERVGRGLEGGGLLQPMSEIRKHRRPTSGFSSSRILTPSHPPLQLQDSSPSSGPLEPPSIHQLDGMDDDGIKDESDDADDDDENAINSDLDDPEDNVVEGDEDDGNQGQIMLCTYDKVQRVKNKWKCTLKDGVLTSGGKEYVFHKAQGEFEW